MAKALPPLKHLELLLRNPRQTRLERDCDPEKLALFVSDELYGSPVDELYPDIASHLDLCAGCLKEYLELSQLSAASMFLLER